MIPLILLFALFLPFILWPIEQIVPYPHIVEELAKMLLILVALNETNKRFQLVKVALGIGTLFAITEGVFFLFNITRVGGIDTFIYRLLITIPFHAVTCLLIVLPALYNKKLIVGGLMLVSMIHYFFNLFIASYSNFPP